MFPPLPRISLLFGALALAAVSARAEILNGKYDMAAVRDPSTLETTVLEDWHQWGKEPGIRQKLIEINLGEWWPGQKVRLPVTLLAPADAPCQYVVVDNAGLTKKAVSPTGAHLRLLKEKGVGLVYIAMTTVDAMEPLGLDVGMKEHLLKTKDMRYTPAWIWGLSDMRALTAALAEKDVFQPKKVIATGGSKRGVATAAAGIADDRFTGIMPVVAPIIDSPGGPYVEGTRAPEIVRANEEFLAAIPHGTTNAPVTAAQPILFREKVRADERITLEQAQQAGWTQPEIAKACTAAWEVCRTTDFLPELKKRGLEIFYNEGSNDNVGPGLLELGRRFPDLHIHVVPGGQHGAAKEAGMPNSVGSRPDVDENLYAFAMHHFFGARPLPATPKLTTHYDAGTRHLTAEVTFPDGTEPQGNDLWWSIDRDPDYTIAMEYDKWETASLHRTEKGSYTVEFTVPEKPRTIDVVSVHKQEANGSTLTFSSPLIRAVGQ